MYYFDPSHPDHDDIAPDNAGVKDHRDRWSRAMLARNQPPDKLVFRAPAGLPVPRASQMELVDDDYVDAEYAPARIRRAPKAAMKTVVSRRQQRSRPYTRKESIQAPDAGRAPVRVIHVGAASAVGWLTMGFVLSLFMVFAGVVRVDSGNRDAVTFTIPEQIPQAARYASATLRPILTSVATTVRAQAPALAAPRALASRAWFNLSALLGLDSLAVPVSASK